MTLRDRMLKTSSTTTAGVAAEVAEGLEALTARALSTATSSLPISRH